MKQLPTTISPPAVGVPKILLTNSKAAGVPLKKLLLLRAIGALAVTMTPAGATTTLPTTTPTTTTMAAKKAALMSGPILA